MPAENRTDIASTSDNNGRTIPRPRLLTSSFLRHRSFSVAQKGSVVPSGSRNQPRFDTSATRDDSTAGCSRTFHVSQAQHPNRSVMQCMVMQYSKPAGNRRLTSLRVASMACGRSTKAW